MKVRELARRKAFSGMMAAPGGHAIETVFKRRTVKPLHVRVYEACRDRAEDLYARHLMMPDPPEEVRAQPYMYITAVLSLSLSLSAS